MPVHLDYPVRFDRGRLAANTMTSVEDIAARVAVIMVIEPGTRINDPDFGAGDPTFLRERDLVPWVDAAVRQEPDAQHVSTAELLPDLTARLRVEVTHA